MLYLGDVCRFNISELGNFHFKYHVYHLSKPTVEQGRQFFMFD